MRRHHNHHPRNPREASTSLPLPITHTRICTNTPGTVSNALGTGYVNTQDFMHGQTYIGHFRDIRPDLQGASSRVDHHPHCLVVGGV